MCDDFNESGSCPSSIAIWTHRNRISQPMAFYCPVCDSPKDQLVLTNSYAAVNCVKCCSAITGKDLLMCERICLKCFGDYFGVGITKTNIGKIELVVIGNIGTPVHSRQDFCIVKRAQIPTKRAIV